MEGDITEGADLWYLTSGDHHVGRQRISNRSSLPIYGNVANVRFPLFIISFLGEVKIGCKSPHMTDEYVPPVHFPSMER